MTNTIHTGVERVRYQCGQNSGSIGNKDIQVTHSRVTDGRHRRLDRVLEQNPVNDRVRNGLHLQKTNSKP